MSVASSLRGCDLTALRPVTQPEQRLHDVTVAGGAIVDRLPLLPRRVDAITAVGCQLTARLRCDGGRSPAHCESSRDSDGANVDLDKSWAVAVVHGLDALSEIAAGSVLGAHWAGAAS